MRLGQHPTLTKTNTLFFTRQGNWDGGSPLHCVAMALALLGKLADPCHLPCHGTGSESIMWNAAWPHYLHGLTLSELTSFISELNLGVKPVTCQGSPREILQFSLRELTGNSPVIVGWRQRHPVTAHAALAIGIEGRQAGRAFDPHALLLLDPAGNEPDMAGFNARLDRHGARQVHYCSPGDIRKVVLEGAVSLRLILNGIAGA